MAMIDTQRFMIPASFVGEKDLLRPSSILDLFQSEASIHANMLNLGFQDILKKNLLWIVNYQEIDIVGQLPRYCDEVLVSTWPHERKRLEYVREYDIKDKNGNLAITGIASWFTINKDTRRLVKDNTVDFVGDYYEFTNYPDFRRKKVNLEPTGEIIKWDYEVMYTDLDHNGHMNNAKYLDIIYNKHLGPLLDNMSKIIISFLHEVKYGDVINMEYFKNDLNDHCFIGNVNNERCFEVVIKEK